MDIWRDLGISSRNTTNKAEFENAELLVMSNSGIVAKKFRYNTVAENTYETANSIIGDFGTKTSKTIFTSFYWLGFCKGAKVRFSDGNELTIDTIVEVKDSKKAQTNGSGIIGLNIIF